MTQRKREELERRVKALSNSRPVWIAAALQTIALIFPPFGLIAIGLMLMWIAVAGMARWATAHQLAELARRERQAEADASDFVNERGDAIRRRMQAMLETEAREQARRQNSPSMFKGNCIDITPEKL